VAAIEAPLFPLKTVLFPGGSLTLRVFEPRYLDMVARCLRGSNRFGVVAIRQGAEVGSAETFDVGTLAEIVDWHQESGGMLGISAVGRESFRIVRSSRAPDGLYVGEIELIPAEARCPLPAEHAELAALLRKLLAPTSQLKHARSAYDDAVFVSHRLSELLPLPLPTKQALLELTDPIARLNRLAAALPSGRPPESI
jgi:Lon protease-like protein